MGRAGAQGGGLGGGVRGGEAGWGPTPGVIPGDRGPGQASCKNPGGEVRPGPNQRGSGVPPPRGPTLKRSLIRGGSGFATDSGSEAVNR